MEEIFENFSLETAFTGLARWIFVALALYILVRSIISLIRAKNPAEVWAYMNTRTYRQDKELRHYSGRSGNFKESRDFDERHR